MKSGLIPSYLTWPDGNHEAHGDWVMRRTEPSQGAVLVVVSIPMVDVTTSMSVSDNPMAQFLPNSDFYP